MEDYKNLSIINIDKDEIWINILELKGYAISSYGRFKILRPYDGDYIKTMYVAKGYVYARGSKSNKTKAFRVNRLVAQYFIPNPQNLPHVNHKDGNKLNNRKCNLEWTTISDNLKHSYNIGLRVATNKAIIVTKDGVDYPFISLRKAGRELKIDQGAITLCCQGKKNNIHGYTFRYA